MTDLEPGTRVKVTDRCGWPWLVGETVVVADPEDCPWTLDAVHDTPVEAAQWRRALRQPRTGGRPVLVLRSSVLEAT